ncbi:hypothetical protein C8J56DRAFT_921149 [Mycena floridula]|nr:hypothetical protein C8J56DRAFT_921149 [Mycena floridula]
MFSLLVALFALCLPFASSELCWGTDGPGSGFGITLPNRTSILLANQEYTIVWDPENIGSATVGPPLEKGDGLMYLQLYQYIPNPGSICRTNFSEPLLTIANGVANSGELKWTPPDTLEINDNFVISGQNIWEEHTLLTEFQSGMFSIKHRSSDVIPPSAEILQSISQAAAQASLSASQSSYWAAASSSRAAANAIPTESSNGVAGNGREKTWTWLVLVSILSGIAAMV